MYRKHSDDKIKEFIDLGNNTYEFCFNIIEIPESLDDESDMMMHHNGNRYEADTILILHMDNILNDLLRDKYDAAQELNIINSGILNQNDSKYKEYQEYLLFINNLYRKFYLTKHVKKINDYSVKKPESEFFNDKYIFRFNENIDTDAYIYDEYIFNEIHDIYDINIINDIIGVDGYKLSDIQCKIITNLTLDDIKKIKISEFDPYLNEFSVLIFRCKLIYDDNIELNNAINLVKNMKNNTINLINSYQSISDILKFNFRKDDIEAMKNLFKNFKI